MSEIETVTDTSWLSEEQLELMRAHVPVVYVEAVPVRVDALGNVTQHRPVAARGRRRLDQPDDRQRPGASSASASARRCCGTARRISARWRCRGYRSIRLRSRSSSTSPIPDKTGFHDPRQHAVSLVYVVPVDGECEPTQEALDLAWFTPAQAASPAVIGQMTGGQDRLLRLALAHVGQLP